MNPANSHSPSPVTPASPHLVSLDDPAAVAASAGWQGRICWISSQPPAAVLGVLLDESRPFEGAWLEPVKAVVQLNGQRIEHTLKAGPPADPGAFLEQLVHKHLAGEPPNRIQADLESSTIH